MWEQKKLVRCSYCYKQPSSYTHTAVNLHEQMSVLLKPHTLGILALFFFFFFFLLMPNRSQLLGIKDKKQKCDSESHLVCFYSPSTLSLNFYFKVPVLPKKSYRRPFVSERQPIGSVGRLLTGCPSAAGLDSNRKAWM